MKKDRLSNKSIMMMIFLFSFAAKVMYGYFDFWKNGTTDWMDAWAYIDLAKNFISQGSFIIDETLLASNANGLPPGYSLTILPVIYIFRDNYLPIIIMNALFSSIIPVFVFLISIDLTERKYAILASIWSILYVEYYIYIADALKESLLCAVFIIIVFLIIKIQKTSDLKYYYTALLSFFSVYLVHIDERYLIFVPLIFLSFFFNKNTFKSHFKRISMYSLLFVLFMIPWTYRNYVVYNKFVLITTRTSIILDKYFYGKQTLERNKNIDNLFKTDLSNRQYDSLQKGIPLTVNGDDKAIKHINEGLKYGIIAHKYNLLEKTLEEFKEFWRPFRFSPGFVYTGFRFEKPWSTKHNLVIILSYGLLLPFLCAGIFFGIRKKNYVITFLAITILFQMLIHLTILYVRTRYRLPIDSLIIIISFYGLFCLINKYFPKSRISGMIGNKTE